MVHLKVLPLVFLLAQLESCARSLCVPLTAVLEEPPAIAAVPAQAIVWDVDELAEGEFQIIWGGERGILVERWREGTSTLVDQIDVHTIKNAGFLRSEEGASHFFVTGVFDRGFGTTFGRIGLDGEVARSFMIHPREFDVLTTNPLPGEISIVGAAWAVDGTGMDLIEFGPGGIAQRWSLGLDQLSVFSYHWVAVRLGDGNVALVTRSVHHEVSDALSLWILEPGDTSWGIEPTALSCETHGPVSLGGTALSAGGLAVVAAMEDRIVVEFLGPERESISPCITVARPGQTAGRPTVVAADRSVLVAWSEGSEVRIARAHPDGRVEGPWTIGPASTGLEIPMLFRVAADRTGTSWRIYWNSGEHGLVWREIPLSLEGLGPLTRFVEDICPAIQ